MYSFQPTAQGPSGTTVGYGIVNKPAWATFSTSTGLLQGTPTAANVGTYPNITISASDGPASATLAPFSITVGPGGTTGTATLGWTAPTTNTNGLPLTDLAGYRVYYGTSSTSLTNVINVAPNADIGDYLVTGLSAGTYYFQVTAYDTAGEESAPSNQISTTIS